MAYLTLKLNRLLVLSLLLLSVFISNLAHATVHSCDQLFQASKSEIALQGLHPLHRRWIEISKFIILENIEKFSMIFLPHQKEMQEVGTQLVINDKNYEIVAWLGHGSEAAVYLVTSANGLQVAKVFNKISNLDFQIKGFSDIENIRIPQILDVDRNRQIILLEYLDGIDMASITRHSVELGIPILVAMQIRRDFEALAKANFWVIVAGSSNTLYSFKTHSFSIIDPH